MPSDTVFEAPGILPKFRAMHSVLQNRQFYNWKDHKTLD